MLKIVFGEEIHMHDHQPWSEVKEEVTKEVA
jgi:hypothetical protein